MEDMSLEEEKLWPAHKGRRIVVSVRWTGVTSSTETHCGVSGRKQMLKFYYLNYWVYAYEINYPKLCVFLFLGNWVFE